MARLAADLGGFYEVAYAPGESRPGTARFRSIEVEVSRGGTKVQDPQRLLRDPARRGRPILAYELPLLEALKAAEPKKDFPITAGTFALRLGPRGPGRSPSSRSSRSRASR